DCIRGDETCAGDNHDALYTRDTGVITPKNLKDFVLVIGVNHQKTGKASYINHSVYDLKKMAGIVAISDPGLTEASAIYHAGLDPQSWRAKLYKNVYAYMISYDCSGRSFCLQIPAPTESDPIGLEPGSPFVVVGRSYLEPQSKVRPAASELIIHQTVIGSSRP
ncbi:MAG: hypothetical protein KDD43_00795, partial [Bdellovibrionales bacterium]|nr:hypothetical protein [Bdellovibrionales bacterium]